jgi:ribosomal protein S18 acetylase RimI-like enzyme
MKARPTGTSGFVEITADNVETAGFFCYMSKKSSEGYQRKLRWLKARFAEGLRLRLAAPPERGFVESIPGEHAWRAVHAHGYLFIHCLWVVGQSKGRGLGAALLDACLADAKRMKMKGVVMLSSEKVWLAGKRIFEKAGFECVDSAPPAFSLLVKKLGKHPAPKFAGGWEEKARACGAGLTVLRSDQCPYIVDATQAALACAKKAGVKSRVIELQSRADVLRLSPTPYGVFGLVLDGRLLSYHYMLEKDLLPLLTSAPAKRVIARPPRQVS